jgi:hypothetical protein
MEADAIGIQMHLTQRRKGAKTQRLNGFIFRFPLRLCVFALKKLYSIHNSGFLPKMNEQKWIKTW